jgi:hypothetical protein
MNKIKRVTIHNLHHKILGDPFRWLRLKQPASEESLSHPFEQRLAGTKSTGDCFSKRVHCFTNSLQKEVDRKIRAQHLREFLSENNSPKEGELRNVLFPDPLQFILPDITATLNIPPQCDAGQVPLGSANLPKGIVTDLYESAWDDWEGFINTVYRFTSESCHCTCPVHLGCIVEFQLTPGSEKLASLVVDRSLKVLEYIPGTLPSEYATDYLKELEQSSDPLHRIHGIVKTTEGDCKDVELFLHLVTLCV